MISTAEYKALAGCIEPDKGMRNKLKGISIEADGTFVATNGAVIAYVETGERVEGMTEPSIVVKPWELPRLKSDRDQPIIIAADSVGLGFVALQGATETRLETIRNIFPAWRHVDAHAGPLHAYAIRGIGFDQRLLTPLDCEYVKFEFGQGARDPIRVTCGAPLERVRVTLMPCRV